MKLEGLNISEVMYLGAKPAAGTDHLLNCEDCQDAAREIVTQHMNAKTHVIEHTKHPDDPREIDKLFVIDIDPPCGHLLHIETDTGSDVPTAGDGYDCEKCGAAITVEQVDHETRIDR